MSGDVKHMGKVGRFFARLWGKVWPAVKVIEPVAGKVVCAVDPKLCTVIVAGEKAAKVIEGIRH
jgi:hypothetical protein